MNDEASYICNVCGEEIVIPLDMAAGQIKNTSRTARSAAVPMSFTSRSAKTVKSEFGRKGSDDAQGFARWHRRWEVGTFRFPIAAEGTNNLAISATDPAMLLDGVELDENAGRLAFDPRREGAKRERDRCDP